MASQPEIPEAATRLMIHLRWVKAAKESRVSDDFTPGDALLSDEFAELHSDAFDELDTASRFDHYNMAFGDICFNSYFNDRELYEFLGMLYLSRLFEFPTNRSAFLLKTRNVLSEVDLLAIVSQGSLANVSTKSLSSVRDNVVKVLETDYFTNLPARYNVENEHLSPVLKRLRSRKISLQNIKDEDKVGHVNVLIKNFRELEGDIVNLYKLADLGPRRDLSEFERCSDEKAFSLFVHDIRRLLGAARRNVFFYDLISMRPPRCGYISHEQALLECAEHARLWLLNAKLPVYYNFDLRYSDLAQAATPSLVEYKAWSSAVGFKAMLLSAEEKRLRRVTLALYWDKDDVGGDPYNLAPEDFATVKDNPAVDIIKFTGPLVVLKGTEALETAVLAIARLAKTQWEVMKAYDPPMKYKSLKKMAKQRARQAASPLNNIQERIGEQAECAAGSEVVLKQVRSNKKNSKKRKRSKSIGYDQANGEIVSLVHG